MKNGLLSLMLLFLSHLALGQGKYDANWCFGVKAGIDFNDTSSPVNFITLCNNNNGAASISDSLGNLLFYLAPDTPFYIDNDFYVDNAIYNNQNKIIINGDSLIEENDLTGSLFLPIPNDSNGYFVLYMNRLDSVGTDSFGYYQGFDYNNLYYAKIIKDSIGYKVVKKNQLLSRYPLEWGLQAIKHANGHDWWLLTHRSNESDPNYASDAFYTFHITGDSILGPFEQDIGSQHNGVLNIGSQIACSLNGDWIAIPLSDQNAADLFNFDRCTGLLQNYTSISNINTLYDLEICGSEFSEDGTKLYLVNGFGDTDKGRNSLYQYSLDSPDINSTQQIIWQDSSFAQFTFGYLSRAPDDKIYLAADNTQYLFVINNPDSPGLACNFQTYGYFLGDSVSCTFGLPNMPNYNLGPLSIYQGSVGVNTTICYSDSITIGNPPLAGVTYSWQPAKGINNATLAQQTVKPDTSTWYYVTLTDTTILYSCQSRTDSVYVQVVHCCDSLLLSQCTLSKDTFICTDIDTPTKGATLFVDTVPGVSFVWQAATGISIHATEQIVDPPQSTWYYVTFFSDTDSASACNQRKDSVYVKVEKCDTTGINNPDSYRDTQHLSIYPNPAQNKATIEWQSDATKDTHILIYDLPGNEVMDVPFDYIPSDKQRVTLDISGLANGMYIVRLSSSGTSVGEGKLAIVR